MYILRLREFAREFVEKAEKFFFTWNFFLRDFRNNNVMGFFCKEFSSWGFLFLFSRDFPTTKLPFAEFPLTFFPFSFCGGVCPSAAGFPILSFRGFPVFLYGIFPPFLYVFSRPFLPQGSSVLLCEVSRPFLPRSFFRQICDKENSRSCPGVFS